MRAGHRTVAAGHHTEVDTGALRNGQHDVDETGERQRRGPNTAVAMSSRAQPAAAMTCRVRRGPVSACRSCGEAQGTGHGHRQTTPGSAGTTPDAHRRGPAAPARAHRPAARKGPHARHRNPHITVCILAYPGGSGPPLPTRAGAGSHQGRQCDRRVQRQRAEHHREVVIRLQNSRSGWIGAPRRTPAYSWCAMVTNHVPASTATAAYSQPAASASTSVASTVSQV